MLTRSGPIQSSQLFIISFSSIVGHPAHRIKQLFSLIAGPARSPNISYSAGIFEYVGKLMRRAMPSGNRDPGRRERSAKNRLREGNRGYNMVDDMMIDFSANNRREVRGKKERA